MRISSSFNAMLSVIRYANIIFTYLFQPAYYPEEAGLPFGGDDGSVPDYYMMEMHYDNPAYDGSKFMFTYLS